MEDLFTASLLSSPDAKTQDSNCLQLSGNLGGLVGMTLLQNCKGCGFESHSSNYACDFRFHRSWETTEDTVLTHMYMGKKACFL